MKRDPLLALQRIWRVWEDIHLHPNSQDIKDFETIRDALEQWDKWRGAISEANEVWDQMHGELPLSDEAF